MAGDELKWQHSPRPGPLVFDRIDFIEPRAAFDVVGARFVRWAGVGAFILGLSVQHAHPSE